MIFSELFTIVVDMLAIVVHGTLAGEMSEKGEENKKVNQSLIRKLKVRVYSIALAFYYRCNLIIHMSCCN